MADVVALIGEASAGVAVPVAVLKADYDTEGDPTSFFGTNGAALVTGAGVTLTDNGSNSTISGLTGAGSLIPGTFAWISNSAGAGSTSDDLYEILSSAATTVTVDNTPLDQTTGILGNDIVDISIGGIFEADTGALLQNAFDLIGPAAGAGGGIEINNLDFLLRASSAISTTAKIDIDNISGSTSTRVRTIGTTSSFVDDGTKVEITTGTLLSSGLFSFFGGVIGLGFENIDFNGSSDSSAGKAENCIRNNSDAEGFIYFKNCRMHNADSHACLIGGSTVTDSWNFIGCEIDNNGLGNVATTGWGISGRTSARGWVNVRGCYIHDNFGGGIIAGYLQAAISNRIIDNGDDGIRMTTNVAFSVNILDNTINGCDGDGIQLNSAYGGHITILNNTVNECVGVGYNLNSLSPSLVTIGNNHSKNNLNGVTTDSGDSHLSAVATLALFETYGAGDNISGDAALDADQIPGIASVLIDAGVGGTGDTIGALCATAGGAGGGVMKLTGLIT